MPLTRRTFLAGTAGAAFLAACGGGDDGGGEDSDAPVADETINLLAVFAQEGALVAGTSQRLTFTLADFEGAPLTRVPASLEFAIQHDQGAAVGDPVTVERRAEGIPVPYYPLVTEFVDPGIYQVTTTVEGEELEPRIFGVSRPSEVPFPQVGAAMVPVATPTTGDPGGVDPICTRDPVCPLHEVTLTDALAEGRPIAFLIATPEFCQTQICGPVLDVVLAQQSAFPDVRMLHAEPYADPRDVANIAQATLSPAIDRYHLPFEPSLFLATADGTITARLDNVFDETELVEHLTALTS